MSATNYTPIQIYYSTTASAVPTAGNLIDGELAINTNDGKLYYKDSGGNVQLLASKAGASGTVTSVSQSFTGGLISVSGSPVTTSGTLALTVAGTSGGVPYFSSASTWASSAALAANALMIGGGAGAAPSTITTGTGVVTALGVNTGSAGAFVVNGGALGTPSSGTLTNATGLPISSGVSGLGTGVATALAVNTGTAGAFVVNGGALGTPSSGTVTNLTGTASININGTVGATTPNTGAFTTLSASGALTYGGVTLTAAVTGTGKMVLDTSPTLSNPTVTNYTESFVSIGTVTSSNTIALTNGTVQNVTLTASTACTFTMPSVSAGKSFVLMVKQAASTGNGTATFTSVDWGTAGAPTITATAGKMDILTFISDGSKWYGSYVQGYTY